MPSVTVIHLLSKDISHHKKQTLADNGWMDNGQTTKKHKASATCC